MSRVKGWNLSHGCLTSFDAREKLRGLKTADPEFWNELTLGTTQKDLPDANTTVEEDTIEAPGDFDDYGDDSSFSISAVISEVMKGAAGMEGGLIAQGLAEDEDAEPVESIDMVVDIDQPTDSNLHTLPPAVGTSSGERNLGDKVRETTSGKRKRTANRWYALKSFIRHNDDEASDMEM